MCWLTTVEKLLQKNFIVGIAAHVPMTAKVLVAMATEKTAPLTKEHGKLLKIKQGREPGIF